MFKAPKRAKKRKQVLSTVADSSSDEEHGATRASGGQHDDDDADNDGDEAGGIGALAAAQLKIKERKDKQKKKKQRRSGASNGVGGGVSFNSEEHDEEVGDFAGERDRSSSTKDRKKQRKKDDKKKRKKRSGGMGFGGATMAFHGEDEKEASDAAAAGLGASALGKEGDAGDDGTVGGSLYDTTALEALRSKQKVYVAPSGDAGDKKDGIESKSKQDGTPSENKTDADRPGTSTSSNPKNLGLGDGKTSFIPLDGSNIVAGDDALAYMEEEDDEREGMASPEAEAARKRDKSALAGTDRLSNGIGSNSVLGGAGDTIDADIDASVGKTLNHLTIGDVMSYREWKMSLPGRRKNYGRAGLHLSTIRNYAWTLPTGLERFAIYRPRLRLLPTPFENLRLIPPSNGDYDQDKEKMI